LESHNIIVKTGAIVDASVIDTPLKPKGKTRFKVERTFGGIKLWFGGGVARYRGIKKMHTQNLMEAMCYNLYRSPGIIASNCEK